MTTCCRVLHALQIIYCLAGRTRFCHQHPHIGFLAVYVSKDPVSLYETRGDRLKIDSTVGERRRPTSGHRLGGRPSTAFILRAAAAITPPTCARASCALVFLGSLFQLPPSVLAALSGPNAEPRVVYCRIRDVVAAVVAVAFVGCLRCSRKFRDDSTSPDRLELNNSRYDIHVAYLCRTVCRYRRLIPCISELSTCRLQAVCR